MNTIIRFLVRFEDLPSLKTNCETTSFAEALIDPLAEITRADADQLTSIIDSMFGINPSRGIHSGGDYTLSETASMHIGQFNKIGCPFTITMECPPEVAEDTLRQFWIETVIAKSALDDIQPEVVYVYYCAD